MKMLYMYNNVRLQPEPRNNPVFKIKTKGIYYIGNVFLI